MCAELGNGIVLTSLLSRGTGSHCSAARGKEKLSDGKEVLGYEMFCDGCVVLREEGQRLGKAEWSEALLWHR